MEVIAVDIRIYDDLCQFEGENLHQFDESPMFGKNSYYDGLYRNRQ